MTNARIKRLIKPLVEPVSLAELKLHLTISPDFTDDDTLLLDLISAARQDAEDYLGQTLAPSTWLLTLDRFPNRFQRHFLPDATARHSIAIEVPQPPLIAVQSVRYLDVNGVSQVLPASAYVVDTMSEPGRIVPVASIWPVTAFLPNAVQIRVTAGPVETVEAEILIVSSSAPYCATVQQAVAFYSVLQLRNAQGEVIPTTQYTASKGVITLANASYAGAVVSLDYLITAGVAKQAIKLRAAAYYANREEFLAGVKIETGDWFERLLDGVGRSQLFGQVS